jgi:hypothetical protein
MEKVTLDKVFSEYFGFPCPYSFHRLLHIHHHLSSGAGTIDQLVADVSSVPSLTPLQETKKKKILRRQQQEAKTGTKLKITNAGKLRVTH